MILAITIIFFVLGLVIGSFLNVVIFRYNTQKFYAGHSMCMSCHKRLKWYELVPLFSFLVLAGRCSGCKTKISIQYPIIEAVTGLIFAGLFLKFQNLFLVSTEMFSLTMAFYATVFSVLIVISVYDLKHKIIPDKLALIVGILGFIGLFFFDKNGFSIHMPSLMQFLSGFVISVPFALIWFLSKGNWMGFGDAKLAVGLGWVLGFSGILSGTVLAFWAGALVGVLLMIIPKKKFTIKSEIPFAPFLVFASILVFIFQISLFPLGF